MCKSQDEMSLPLDSTQLFATSSKELRRIQRESYFILGFTHYTPCESSNSKTCPSGSCTVNVYSPHGFWLGAPSTGNPASFKCWYNPSTSDVPNSTCVAPYFKSPNSPLPMESRANSPERCTTTSMPGIIW